MKIFSWLLLLSSQSVIAQKNLTIRVTASQGHQPMQGVTVTINSIQKTTATDTNGVAVLRGISPGSYQLQCSSVGYRALQESIVFPQRGTDTLHLEMVRAMETMQDVVISSTRTNQLLKNVPLTVQVVDQDDIEEGTAESPGNLRELLTELSGTQMQQTSAVSGNVTIRLQGLDGRYTQLLKDGFPIFGGFSQGLSIMQVPPLDLKRVEVIKGAGSALYGGDAIAGIINLISRTPDSSMYLNTMVNQTSRGETDLSGFYSHRTGHTGLTLLATTTEQRAADVNKDGFTDLPQLHQLTLNPTFYWYPDENTTLRLGVNITGEKRKGGDMIAVNHGSDSLHPFLQASQTNRDYYQLSLVHHFKDHKTLTVKNSISNYYRRLSQPGANFSGTQLFSFSEVSLGSRSKYHQDILGLDLTTDHFSSGPPHTNLSYAHNTAGVFAQDDWKFAKSFTLETGARADKIKNMYFLPRIALLYKINHHWTTRVGGGLAYKLPTIFTDQDEESGYQQVDPIAPGVGAERSSSSNISFNYRGYIGNAIGFTIDQNFFYTGLRHALTPQADSLQLGRLYYTNVPGPISSQGFETNARLSLDNFSLYLGYTYVNARENYLPGKPRLPLTPQGRLVGTFMYEKDHNWKSGLESFYTGRQFLDNGIQARTFWTFDFMAEKEFGDFSLLFNIEDFTDTRQSRWEPLYTGTIQNPAFNQVYTPLEGMVANLAVSFKIEGGDKD